MVKIGIFAEISIKDTNLGNRAGDIEAVRVKFDSYDGEWENYDERGMLVGEGSFVNGTGKRFSYDEKGRLRSETNFVNNKKEGLETHYLASGEIEKTILFKEDRIIEINGKTVEDL